MRTFLVDDESKALSVLESKLLRFCPEIEIIGKTQSSIDAIQLIKTMKPELIFLDITMPAMNGFELLSHIENPDFEIIFVTAHNDFAIEAIRHCAIGYIVKPISTEELVLSVNRAMRNKRGNSIEKNKQLIMNQSLNLDSKKIAIPTQQGFDLIRIKDIIRFEGDDGYTQIHFVERSSILSSYSIGYFHRLLEKSDFFLTHKSHLINTYHIEKYSNDGYVHLSNNNCAPVSKTRRSDFLQKIKGHA